MRVVAGASPTAGSTYTPITAAWAGNRDLSGRRRDVGHVGSGSGTHVFTVSTASSGAAGSPVSIDPSVNQRMLITDAGSGTSLGASFLATATPARRSA